MAYLDTEIGCRVPVAGANSARRRTWSFGGGGGTNSAAPEWPAFKALQEQANVDANRSSAKFFWPFQDSQIVLLNRQVAFSRVEGLLCIPYASFLFFFGPKLTSKCTLRFL